MFHPRVHTQQLPCRPSSCNVCFMASPSIFAKFPELPKGATPVKVYVRGQSPGDTVRFEARGYHVTEVNTMPPTEPRPDEDDRAMLAAWIDCRAPSEDD